MVKTEKNNVFRKWVVSSIKWPRATLQPFGRDFNPTLLILLYYSSLSQCSHHLITKEMKCTVPEWESPIRIRTRGNKVSMFTFPQNFPQARTSQPLGAMDGQGMKEKFMRRNTDSQNEQFSLREHIIRFPSTHTIQLLYSSLRMLIIKALQKQDQIKQGFGSLSAD